MTSCVVTGYLVSSIWCRIDLKTGEHALLLREVHSDIRCRNVQNSQADLEEAMAAAPALEAHKLRRRTKTGAWLNLLPSTVNRTDIGVQEWRNSLFLCYNIEPPYLYTH